MLESVVVNEILFFKDANRYVVINNSDRCESYIDLDTNIAIFWTKSGAQLRKVNWCYFIETYNVTFT